MIDRTQIKAKLSTRERIVLWFILLAIRILAPWQFEHQFKELVQEIQGLITGIESE